MKVRHVLDLPESVRRGGVRVRSRKNQDPVLRASFFASLLLVNVRELGLNEVYEALNAQIGGLCQGQELKAVKCIDNVHGWHVEPWNVLVEEQRQPVHETLPAAIGQRAVHAAIEKLRIERRGGGMEGKIAAMKRQSNLEGRVRPVSL